MSKVVFEAGDEAATDRLGSMLAGVLPPGTVVALLGTLGAGKTRLVQAIAAACGVPREDVVSPTFVLCQQYRGKRTINHLDAYRLREVNELRELGIEELFASDAITIIEWADRVADALPDEFVEVTIEVTAQTARRFVVRGQGARYGPVIAELGHGASGQ